MRHIIIRVTPIVGMASVFNDFYEIIRDKYSDFWRKAVFTRSRTVVLNDCGVKIHFIQGDNNPVELVGIRPYWKFELNYPDQATIRRLAHDVVNVCEDLIALQDSDVVEKYCKNDIIATKDLINSLNERGYFRGDYHVHPEKVIFNPPATIVYWCDGTRTIVKCQDGDEFDPEKGLAMAYIKKNPGLKSFYKCLNDGIKSSPALNKPKGSKTKLILMDEDDSVIKVLEVTNE